METNFKQALILHLTFELPKKGRKQFGCLRTPQHEMLLHRRFLLCSLLMSFFFSLHMPHVVGGALRLQLSIY